MKTIKVLHVIDSMDPKFGGVCQAVRTMVAGLDRDGVVSEIISLDAADAPFLKADPFLVHAIGPSKGPWSYSSELIPWLTENISRFDTIILHGMWLYNGYALNKALKKEEKPPRVLIMPHGMLDPYFQKSKSRKLKALRNWIYWKLIERYVVNGADGLLFTCEEEKRLARTPFKPYKPKREVVIGLGVQEPPKYNQDMRDSFLQQCPELNQQPYIIFLSRIHEKKGVDLLIKAYTQVYLQYTENGKQVPNLVIAGPGLDTPYGEKIKSTLLSYVQLKNKVFFPGMLMGDAKWGAFYGCDAFILPSHQENFGIAVVEALACAKPVLISNRVNIWREIEAGGGLVADDTEEGTFEILEKWQKLTKNEKQAMASSARNTYEQYFAIRPAAARLLEVLNSEAIK
jgi:glycosyltransferase involved in cell wall biosynthesis